MQIKSGLIESHVLRRYVKFTLAICNPYLENDSRQALNYKTPELRKDLIKCEQSKFIYLTFQSNNRKYSYLVFKISYLLEVYRNFNI